MNTQNTAPITGGGEKRIPDHIFNGIKVAPSCGRGYAHSQPSERNGFNSGHVQHGEWLKITFYSNARKMGADGRNSRRSGFPCVHRLGRHTPISAKGQKISHYHNTPTSFATLLSKAKEYADQHPDQPKLITINAWNEWVEGSYLLPDMLYGFEYLEAVKDVFIDKKYDRY